MAKRFFSSRQQNVESVKFGETSFDLLKEFLIIANEKNKNNLKNLPKYCGIFKQRRVVEFIFLVTDELKLDPLVGYHAIELVQRFMVGRLTDLLSTSETRGATAALSANLEEAVFDMLKDKLPLLLFSCVQLASKVFLHNHMIDCATAVRFLNSVGLNVSRKAVLQSEMTVFKGLRFKLNVLNPLAYVEVLLEVLAHNEPSFPVERLHQLCQSVLLLITLQRIAVYDCLLKVVTQCACPTQTQREKFVTVTEDCMLLGVSVIAVATFIDNVGKWDQVLDELSHITAISSKSIRDFACVTLAHINSDDVTNSA